VGKGYPKWSILIWAHVSKRGANLVQRSKVSMFEHRGTTVGTGFPLGPLSTSDVLLDIWSGVGTCSLLTAGSSCALWPICTPLQMLKLPKSRHCIHALRALQYYLCLQPAPAAHTLLCGFPDILPVPLFLFLSELWYANVSACLSVSAEKLHKLQQNANKKH